jgi:DNA-directed RNA polymerase specialized sigma24 family protein
VRITNITTITSNPYEGVLTQSEYDHAVKYAKCNGLPAHDIPDALQEVSIAILDFRFDPSKANGACERTARTAIIRKSVLKFLRTQSRYGGLVDRFTADLDPDTAFHNPDDQLEVTELWQVVARLDTNGRHICEALAEGKNVHEIATELGLHWVTVQRAIAKIREYMEKSGIDGAIGR